jgi:hypothetical protein
VQAVGKPGLKNQMSGPVRYISACGKGAHARKISLEVSPSSATIAPGQSTSTSITVSSNTGAFDAPVSFSCSNLPAGMTCSFAPEVVTSASATGSSVLTVSAASVMGALDPVSQGAKLPISTRWFVLGIACLGLFQLPRKGLSCAGLVVIVAGMAILMSACGGGRTSGSVAPATISWQNYNIMITAVSGRNQASTTETISIRQ